MEMNFQKNELFVQFSLLSTTTEVSSNLLYVVSFAQCPHIRKESPADFVPWEVLILL